MSLSLTNKEQMKDITGSIERGIEKYSVNNTISAGTAQIAKLADGDLSRTNVFAKIAIRKILKLSMSELPKKLTIPFE